MPLIRFPRLRAVHECLFLARTFAHYPQLLEQFTQEAREHYVVYRRKTEWCFSGVDRSPRGITDLGFTRSPCPMNRAEAMRYCREFNEHATIIHVDDRNKVITFSISH